MDESIETVARYLDQQQAKIDQYENQIQQIQTQMIDFTKLAHDALLICNMALNINIDSKFTCNYLTDKLITSFTSERPYSTLMKIWRECRMTKGLR